MTRKDPADRIVALALTMVPCTHLAVWAQAKAEIDGLDPSSVWRALITSGRFQRDSSSGHFRLLEPDHDAG